MLLVSNIIAVESDLLQTFLLWANITFTKKKKLILLKKIQLLGCLFLEKKIKTMMQEKRKNLKQLKY